MASPNLFCRENSIGKLSDWESAQRCQLHLDKYGCTHERITSRFSHIYSQQDRTPHKATRFQTCFWVMTDAFTDVLLQHEWKSGRTERWVSCKLHKLQTPISHQSQPPTVRLQKTKIPVPVCCVPHRHITDKNAKCHFTTVPETLSEYHEIIRRIAGLNISRPYMTHQSTWESTAS